MKTSRLPIPVKPRQWTNDTPSNNALGFSDSDDGWSSKPITPDNIERQATLHPSTLFDLPVLFRHNIVSPPPTSDSRAREPVHIFGPMRDEHDAGENILSRSLDSRASERVLFRNQIETDGAVEAPINFRVVRTVGMTDSENQRLAERHHRVVLLRKSMAALKEEWWNSRRLWRMEIRAKCLADYHVMRRVYDHWRCSLCEKQMKRRAVAYANQRNASRCMRAWTEYMLMRRHKLALTRSAEAQRRITLLRQCWQHWYQRREFVGVGNAMIRCSVYCPAEKDFSVARSYVSVVVFQVSRIQAFL